MEGKQFSSSRGVVIYVRDVLDRYQPDALRYFISAAGPENQDTDFTWAEFVRRTNDELVAGWGNLVNRTASLIHKNLGAIPEAGELTDEDRALLAQTQQAFQTVGDLIERHRQKQALAEAMRIVGEANKYLSDTAPWKLKTTDPARMATVLHVAAQAVSDARTLLSPFLPFSAQAVHEVMGGTGTVSPMPEIREVEDLDGGPALPRADGRLLEPGPVGVGADRARHTDRPAHAGLHQARRRGRRPRGAGAARAQGRVVSAGWPPAPRTAPATRRRRPLPPGHPGGDPRRGRRGAQPGRGPRGGRRGRRTQGGPGRLRRRELPLVGRGRRRASRSSWPASPCTPTRLRAWPRPVGSTRRTPRSKPSPSTSGCG